MRFVLVSTHVDQTTGYSKVAYNLLKQVSALSPKVKTFHFGFQRSPGNSNIRKAPEGVTVYDAAANEDPKQEGFGFNKIVEYLDMVQPDIVMIYNDPLIIYRFLETMKYDKATSPFKIWLYVDQVYTGIAPPLVEAMNKAAERIYCFTDSWSKEYTKYPGGRIPQVMEHAVDPNTFTCMPLAVRQSLRKTIRAPDDGIVFLNANRNSGRKRLDLTVMAFVELLTRETDRPYYLFIVTSLNPQQGAYYDLQRIFVNELSSRAMDVDKYAARLLLLDTTAPNTLTDAQINELYNMSDIGLNTSDGEGYGLCQLEHLYTGAPQIVTDVGSYRSFLTDDVALFVQPNGRQYFPAGLPLGLSGPTFDAKAIADAMEDMAKNLDKRKAATKRYPFKSWAAVCDGWLEDIQAYVA